MSEDRPETKEEISLALPGARACTVLLLVTACALAGCARRASNTRGAESSTRWPFDTEEARRRQRETSGRLSMPLEKSIDLGGGVRLELVLIPAGVFLMGSPKDEAGRSEEDELQHRRRIDHPFYLGKFEVTQEQWVRVMGANPSTFNENPLCPVECVSWSDCRKFLERLNKMVSDAGHRLRLPSETEWEWACRAGTGTPFCFGSDEDLLKKYAWHKDNSGMQTHPVGSKAPNAWGLYDCHGNVEEWCSDFFEAYGAPAGPGGSRREEDSSCEKRRVMRGGSWNSYPWHCRSAYRQPYFPGSGACQGLRVALSLSAAP